jgi:uncharacterized membrane protein YfcA
MDEFTAIQYIGSSIIAGFVGFMTGIFGVGGGFLMTPMLASLLNIEFTTGSLIKQANLQEKLNYLAE